MSKSTLHTKFGTANLNDRYYKITSYKEGNCNKYLHRVIFEDFYGWIPEGYHVHHKDGNPLNNCIMNLQLVHWRKHLSDHAKGEKNVMYGKTHTPEVRKKLSELKTGVKWSEEEKMKHSAKKSTSGYYGVSKHKSKQYSQGFFWQYQYYEGNKRKIIVGKTLEALKEKVLAKGLLWVKFDN